MCKNPHGDHQPVSSEVGQPASIKRIPQSVLGDLSFPARLKIYLENIYVTGIVSKYDENGRPRGLCRAERLYYVTTAGGPFDGI